MLPPAPSPTEFAWRTLLALSEADAMNSLGCLDDTSFEELLALHRAVSARLMMMSASQAGVSSYKRIKRTNDAMRRALESDQAYLQRTLNRVEAALTSPVLQSAM